MEGIYIIQNRKSRKINSLKEIMFLQKTDIFLEKKGMNTSMRKIPPRFVVSHSVSSGLKKNHRN